MWNRSIIAGILILICLAISFFTMFEEKRMFQDFTTWNSTTSSVVSADEEEEQHGAAGTCGDEDASTITTTGNGAEPVVTNAGIDDTSNSNHGCPNNLVFVQDKMLPMNITHTDKNRPIPRVVHFFVKSKCLPKDLAENVLQWKEQLVDHSVLLHDQNEIAQYLTKERSDSKLPFVAKAFHCAIQHEAILDLARLVWLHDHGGISVDIDHVPGESFLNGTLLDNKQLHFVIEDHESHPYPRFVATTPGHIAIFGSVLLTTATQYRQHVFNSTAYGDYTSMRNDIYRHAVKPFQGHDWNKTISFKAHVPNSLPIGIVHSKRSVGKMFIQTTITNKSSYGNQFSNDNGLKKCVDLTNDSNQIDVKALLDVSGGIEAAAAAAACPKDQIYMHNTFDPGSVNQAGRKVPKIIHMTSKNKCFTKKYSDNADLWKFEGYSFFMHDDVAVQRLVNSKAWPEFPLLKEALPCLNSGAMKADYWRYLATWEFGGIYTDMDNAPGYQFNNGSIIADDDDALFEVERGGFPSQYFYASKFSSLPLPNSRQECSFSVQVRITLCFIVFHLTPSFSSFIL